MPDMVKVQNKESSEHRLVVAVRRVVDIKLERLESWKAVLAIVRTLSFIWLWIGCHVKVLSREAMWPDVCLIRMTLSALSGVIVNGQCWNKDTDWEAVAMVQIRHNDC